MIFVSFFTSALNSNFDQYWDKYLFIRLICWEPFAGDIHGDIQNREMFSLATNWVKWIIGGQKLCLSKFWIELLGDNFEKQILKEVFLELKRAFSKLFLKPMSFWRNHGFWIFWGKALIKSSSKKWAFQIIFFWKLFSKFFWYQSFVWSYFFKYQ